MSALSSFATRRGMFSALAAAAGLAPSPTPMRHPGKPGTREPELVADTSAIPLPPATVRWLQKATFGHTNAEYTRLQAMGATDDARWQAWVTEQLNPTAINDAACTSRITAAGYLTLNKTL